MPDVPSQPDRDTAFTAWYLNPRRKLLRSSMTEAEEVFAAGWDAACRLGPAFAAGFQTGRDAAGRGECTFPLCAEMAWEAGRRAESELGHDPRECSYQDGYNAGQDEAYEHGKAAGWDAATRAEQQRWLSAIQQLHSGTGENGTEFCDHDGFVWPCRTTRIVADLLGGDHD